MKFGTLQQLLNPMTVFRTACQQRPHDKNCKFLKSKMADGRHFENRYIAISVKNRPILIKFGHYIRYWTRLRPRNQELKFLNSRWRRPPAWKSLFFGHNSLADCLISAKFWTRKQNSMPTMATWQKLQVFKIQNCGRPPFWRLLIYHHPLSENIVGFWQNLVYYIMYWTWWGFQKCYRRILDVIR